MVRPQPRIEHLRLAGNRVLILRQDPLDGRIIDLQHRQRAHQLVPLELRHLVQLARERGDLRGILVHLPLPGIYLSFVGVFMRLLQVGTLVMHVRVRRPEIGHLLPESLDPRPLGFEVNDYLIPALFGTKQVVRLADVLIRFRHGIDEVLGFGGIRALHVQLQQFGTPDRLERDHAAQPSISVFLGDRRAVNRPLAL